MMIVTHQCLIAIDKHEYSKYASQFNIIQNTGFIRHGAVLLYYDNITMDQFNRLKTFVADLIASDKYLITYIVHHDGYEVNSIGKYPSPFKLSLDHDLSESEVIRWQVPPELFKLKRSYDEEIHRG